VEFFRLFGEKERRPPSATVVVTWILLTTIKMTFYPPFRIANVISISTTPISWTERVNVATVLRGDVLTILQNQVDHSATEELISDSSLPLVERLWNKGPSPSRLGDSSSVAQ